MGRLFAVMAIVMGLSACGVSDRMGKRVDDTWAGDMLFSDNEKVLLTSDAGIELNPDASGNPLSVVIRVYQLSSLGRFASVDADSLWDDPKKALGGTLLTVNELVLLPGFGQNDQWPLLPAAGYVGVAAFFRDNSNSRWKVAFAADSLRKDGIWFSSDGLRVLLDKNQISVARGADALDPLALRQALAKADAQPEQAGRDALTQNVQETIEQSLQDSAKQSLQKSLDTKFDSLAEGIHE